MPIQPTSAEGIEGWVEIYEPYLAGLQDLNDFSHIILLYYFHKVHDPLLVVTPFFLWRVHQVKRITQLIFTSLSFVAWLYTMGGPFREWGIYEPWIGAVLLVLWTLVVPLFLNPQPEKANR